MDLFRVVPTDDEFAPPRRYAIEARPRWYLPGVECPVCDETWGDVGLSYPAFDLTPLAGGKAYERAQAVPLDEWRRLRDAVASVVPDGARLDPGTSFGPLVGKARGRFGDFAWLNKWRLLLAPPALARLESAGLRSLVTVPARLAGRGKAAGPDLLELHIESGAWLVDGARRIEPCRGCGRREFSRPKRGPLVIDRATVPADRPLFRLNDLSTHILATQEFRDAACYFEFSDIEFEDVEVV